MTSVLIASLEPLVSLGLRVTLDREPDFDVVGEVSEAADIVGAVAAHNPDLLLLDSKFQQRSDTLMRDLSGKHPSCKIVVLVDHTDESCTLRSLLAGPREHKPADDALRIMQECCLLALRESAHGCVPKASPPEQVVTALRSVMAGELCAGPGLAQHWREWWQEGSAEAAADDQRLTAREIEIVGLVVDGKSNATIADELGLREQTVKNHVARIMSKLRVRNRVELALKAVRGHIA